MVLVIALSANFMLNIERACNFIFIPLKVSNFVTIEIFNIFLFIFRSIYSLMKKKKKSVLKNSVHFELPLYHFYTF